jgi:uncharacterized protein YjiS (DUF1127 family)
MGTILQTGRARSSPGSRFGATLLGALLVVPLFALQLIAFWLDLARQRRALGRLDDRLLKDIGVSRADVEQEVAKPFWRYH